MGEGMKILLTNDDGVQSPGIMLFAEGLRRAGHSVFVFAPASNQSGVSHSLTFFRGPRKIREIGENTWSCEGTPADCVVLALMGVVPEYPEVVVSGINRGANLGTDIVYSGTAAAARQGAFDNVPSLAFSLNEGDGGYQGEWHWDMAVGFAVENFERILGFWKPDSFININIPNRPEKPLELVRAFPSFRYYNDSIDIYHAPDGRRYCFAKTGKATAKPEQGSDWEAVMGNNASLSEIYIHPVLLESVVRGRV
jgi:5'-nucleotidase